MRSRQALIENILCFALLAIVPVVIGLSSSVPLALDHALTLPPWEEAAPAGFQAPPDPFARIHTLQTYPWHYFLHHVAEARESVLWNPNEGFGAPFFAIWRTRVLSPFSIPFYVFPLGVALRLSVLLKVLVSGWCAYYAGRRFGLKPALALFVGAAFELSAPMLLWSSLGMGDVLPWFPLLLLAAERLMLGDLRAWPQMALTLALMGLGGDPETLCTSAVFVGFYMLARRLRDRRWAHLRMAITGLAIAVLFALGICAIQLAPYAEFQQEGSVRPLIEQASLRLSHLAALVAPGWSAPQDAGAARHIALIHGGLVPLLLLPLWFAVRRFVNKALRRRVEALCMGALALFIVPFAVGRHWVPIPYLDAFGPQHFLIAHAFAFAFLVAAGAEEWNELNPERCREAVRRLMRLIPAFWGAPLCGGVALLLLAGAPVFSAFASMGLPLLVCAGIIVLLLITLARPSVRVMGYGLTALCAGALVWTFWPMMPRTPSQHMFPETRMLASLRSFQSRIGGSEALRGWPVSANDVPQVFCPSGIELNRYAGFIERAKGDPFLLRRCGLHGLLLTKDDIKGAYAPVRADLNIQDVYPAGAVLFRDLKTRPRASMLYQGRRVDHFDPAQLNSALPPLLEGSTLPEKDVGPAANAWTEDSETHDLISVQIEKTRPGVLVLSDAWYPGWTATVDGNVAEVIPVDGALRGVEVGEGEHLAVFSYQPFSFELGKWISAFSAVCVLISLKPLLFRRRHPFDGLS